MICDRKLKKLEVVIMKSAEFKSQEVRQTHTRRYGIGPCSFDLKVRLWDSFFIS